MINVKEVAIYHSNLFRLHDDEDWGAFGKNVVYYLVAIGYKWKNAEKASHNVIKAYQYADMAVKAQERDSKSSEKRYYRECLKQFIIAHETLGIETYSVVYKVRWYEAARHKDVINVLWNLFMEHYSKMGILRFGLVCYLTYLTFVEAYPAHNSHDWPRLIKVLEKYWISIASSYNGYTELPVEL